MLYSFTSSATGWEEPSAVIWYLRNRLRKLYSGIYHVYRVKDPDLISGIMGNILSALNSRYLEDEQAPYPEELEFTIVGLKIYCILNRLTGGVRFVVWGAVHAEENLSGSVKYGNNAPLNLFTDSLDMRDLKCLPHDKFVNGVELMDRVLDSFCVGEFSKEMLEECKWGVGRDLEMDFGWKRSKQWLSVKLESRLP